MKFFKKSIYFLALLFLILTVKISNVNAQGSDIKTFEAKVVEIIEEKDDEIEGQKQLYQKIELEIIKGKEKGNIIRLENGGYNQIILNTIEYKVGDKVLISKEKDLNGNDHFIITDFIRRDKLLFLFVIFIVLTLIIARIRGLTSLLSMGFTFGVLIIYVLPRILSGENPLLVVIVASIFIIPISFYISHGFNKKTTVAIIGSVISLLITAILAFVFINLTKLTGLSSEEAGMLFVNNQMNINMTGLLLAGIIIGSLGILDDITISQSSIVNELISNEEKTNRKDVYKQAMNVGRDHISSMINTLVLAYAGVSLPLLLIFFNNPHPISEIVNYEFIAEEIVRTLVGSIGLVLAVPITTLIAVNWIKKNKC